MHVVKVYPLYKRRALVTRESASLLRGAVFADKGRVALDLSGIEAITPSFIDQMLLIVEESLGRDSDRLDVLLLNAPPGMEKLRPIGRAHHASVAEDAKGNWVSNARNYVPVDREIARNYRPLRQEV